jgi:hypothetical protein
MSDSQIQPAALIAEIKLLLQTELSEVKDSMNNIRLEIADLKGATVLRHDFESALEAERKKREALEIRTNDLDKQLTAMQHSTKIYIGIASAVASIIASGVAALIFGML